MLRKIIWDFKFDQLNNYSIMSSLKSSWLVSRLINMFIPFLGDRRFSDTGKPSMCIIRMIGQRV